MVDCINWFRVVKPVWHLLHEPIWLWHITILMCSLIQFKPFNLCQCSSDINFCFFHSLVESSYFFNSLYYWLHKVNILSFPKHMLVWYILVLVSFERLLQFCSDSILMSAFWGEVFNYCFHLTLCYESI